MFKNIETELVWAFMKTEGQENFKWTERAQVYKNWYKTLQASTVPSCSHKSLRRKNKDLTSKKRKPHSIL